MDYNEVIDFDCLYESMSKCRANVSWKTSVQSFLLNDIDRIISLSESLKNGTYKEKPKKYFTVHEPKERKISSLAFIDRVYQRSLIDNLVYPQMIKHLIYDNVACLENKGTDFGRRRLKRHMQKAYKRWGYDCWVLQIDVKGYYPNMSHYQVEKMFRKYLNDDTFYPVKVILDDFEGDYGYQAGSQLIQMAGVCLLNDVDHFAKENLHIKEYIRYIDDTIIFAPSKEQAEFWLSELEKEYTKKECSLNRKKTKIFSLKKGVTFLGFDFQIKETGKVIQTVNRKRIRCKKIKYKKMLRRVYFDVDGKKPVTKEKFNECIRAYMNHIGKGNSYNILQNFKMYISERDREYVKEFNAKTREITSTD